MSESIVRATCPACGDVVVTTRDIGLRLDEEQSRFLFSCPRCHRQVSRDVPSGLAHVLRVAGVRIAEPEPELIGKAELAEFLADFDRPDCLDELRRLGA